MMSTGARRLAAMWLVAAWLLSAGQARCEVALPPVNLGDSTFQDGIAGPGAMFQQTLSAYRANTSRDENGRHLQGMPKVTSVAVLTQLSYLSEHRVLGAYWGGEVIVPFTHVRLKPPTDEAIHATGAGDIFVSPFILQWPAVSLSGRSFWQRLNLNMTLPTARHGRPGRMDLGSGALQLNPHYAFTWEASPEWEISGRVHYLWVDGHHALVDGGEKSRAQPGQAVHLNLAVSRSANENLRIGGSMYVLMQISNDRIDGADRPGRERVFGFGPSLSWKRGRTSLHAAAYIEAEAKMRSEGSRLSLRYAVNL
ncbi:transporter [Pseudoxanthomonas sp. LjRoot143]|uniref:SphA family protein n=1 Tax=Pseudoxanthomonas sp. LjRoot143 TaxID=3342266 RepID=UPI003ED089F8